MTRIKSLTKRLAIWVFPNDHAPPHFYIIAGDETDVLVDLRTLDVIVGHYDRRDLVVGIAWAAKPENRVVLEAEWSRLNERD